MSAKGGAAGLMTRTPPPTAVDPQLGAGRIIPLRDVIAVGFEQSDLVWLGQGDHHHGDVLEAMHSSEALIGAAEGGAAHVALEASPGEAIHGQTQSTADLLGMKIHRVDPIEQTVKQAGEEKLITDPAGYRQYMLNRLDMDSKVARNIRDAVPEGEKMFVNSYGAAHMSQGEFPRALRGMHPLKIDVYSDRAAYDSMMANAQRINEGLKSTGDNHRMFVNPPEAVYFTTPGAVYTTKDTPDWFRAKLDTMGTPAPSLDSAPAAPAPSPAPETPAPAAPPAP